jgi:hypothetical protein
MPGPYSTEFFERDAAFFVQEGFLEVRADGSVWRIKHQLGRPGFVPKRVDHGKRHKSVKLHWPPGEIHSVPVQRLVWQVHKGNIPAGQTVNHKDGDPTNNRISNLELMTQSEQQKHRYRVLGHKTALQALQERYDELRAAAEEAVRTGHLDALVRLLSS